MLPDILDDVVERESQIRVFREDQARVFGKVRRPRTGGFLAGAE
jgi:hypothetical protein